MPAPTPFDVIYSPFEAGVLPAFAVDPDEGELIPVSFNPTYFPYVVGAIKALVQPALYKGVPDIELQLNRANLLLSMFNNPNAYQRPFYDDDGQMDDSTLPTAPWYEQVSDWVITLFLAITFTPGAAIVYITTIPRLRLAFRTGNIGTIVRVLIDDIEVWTGSTYSASEGMLETVIDVPALPGVRRSLLPGQHELKVVHAGETGQKLEVIRGDLRPNVQTKLRMSALCGTLQVSYDNGVTWADLVDVNTCATTAANAAIDTAINNGTIATPNQAAPGGNIPVNECHTYNVTLAANQRWLCPVPIASGYRVQIENAQGGWSDSNTITSQWFCPQGTFYSLGVCGPTYAPTQPTDPNQAAAHMRLVGVYNTTWIDAYNTTTVIPTGVVQTNLYLQANDGSLSDNNGSITFKVTVCNYSQFCHEFDFTASNGGWVADDPRTAVWVVGQGWRLKPVSANWGAKISLNTSAFVILEYELWYANNGLSTTFSYMRGGADGSVQLKNPALTGSPSLWQGSQSGTTGVNLTLGGNMTDHLYDVMVSKIRLRGEGVDQWGGSNCT